VSELSSPITIPASNIIKPASLSLSHPTSTTNLTRAVRPNSGPTWPSTRLSEARSYYNLAAANHFFNLLPSPPASDTGDPIAILTPTDPAPPTSSRILLEERALDSYYNILFSLVAFWRAYSVWPRRLTIVSHGFKRVRLVEGHCQAIGFPLDRIDFVGINPPGVDDDVGAALTCAAGSSGEGGAGRDLVGEEKKEVMKGVQLTLGQWKDDPHGVGEDLAGKRRKRNCWGVDQRLFLSEEERERSGVDVRTLEDGSEALVEGGRRPWADE
jgi:hypothetical protein